MTTLYLTAEWFAFGLDERMPSHLLANILAERLAKELTKGISREE